MKTLIRSTTASVLALSFLAACGGNTEDNAGGTVDTTTAAATPATVDTTASAGAMGSATWTPGAVMGFTSAVNSGEIELGKLAQQKATNKDVKDFGKKMVDDHSAMLKDMTKLGTKLSAAPDTTASQVSQMQSHARDEKQQLTDMAKGPEWDKAYMDKMVQGHQDVLQQLQQAMASTTDNDLKDALQKAVDKVQEHLNKAQEVRGKLQ